MYNVLFTLANNAMLLFFKHLQSTDEHILSKYYPYYPPACTTINVFPLPCILFLVLLDLSAVFDKIDHSVVMHYLNLLNISKAVPLTSVYVAFLDASKAIDKISHWTLFRKLIDRNVPMYSIKILCYWYQHQVLMPVR